MRVALAAVALFSLATFAPIAAADGSCIWVNYAGSRTMWCEYEEGPVTDTGETLAQTCQDLGLYGGGRDLKIECEYHNEDDWYWAIWLPDPTDDKYEM